MALRTTVTHFVVTRLLERPAAKAGIAGLIASLQHYQTKIEARILSKADNARHRAVLSHIIGIERWGQNRLNVALGAPFVRDEYNGYRPAKSATMAELLAAFRTTRAETIALAHQIEAAGKGKATVPHNSFGDLTTVGWLRYLDLHAFWESKKIW